MTSGHVQSSRGLFVTSFPLDSCCKWLYRRTTGCKLQHSPLDCQASYMEKCAQQLYGKNAVCKSLLCFGNSGDSPKPSWEKLTLTEEQAKQSEPMVPGMYFDLVCGAGLCASRWCAWCVCMLAKSMRAACIISPDWWAQRTGSFWKHVHNNVNIQYNCTSCMHKNQILNCGARKFCNMH